MDKNRVNQPTALEPFKTLKSDVVHQSPLFDIVESDVLHPTTQKTRTFVGLKNANWVNVVAELTNGNLLMVRQWRHGSQAFEVEFPAGLVDPGESALEAGVREVREETGHAPDDVREIGWVKPNTAYQENRCTTLWARGCSPVAQQDLDAFEEVELVEVTPDEVGALIAEGSIRSAMTICAYFWWRQAKESSG